MDEYHVTPGSLIFNFFSGNVSNRRNLRSVPHPGNLGTVIWRTPTPDRPAAVPASWGGLGQAGGSKVKPDMTERT